MSKETGFFYYEINNMSTDSIDRVGTLFTGGCTAAVLASSMPGLFWLEPDSNGTDWLCCTKVIGEPLTLTVNMNTTPYTTEPIPFRAVLSSPTSPSGNIFGPNPTVIFKPGK